MCSLERRIFDRIACREMYKLETRFCGLFANPMRANICMATTQNSSLRTVRSSPVTHHLHKLELEHLRASFSHGTRAFANFRSSISDIRTFDVLSFDNAIPNSENLENICKHFNLRFQNVFESKTNFDFENTFFPRVTYSYRD